MQHQQNASVSNPDLSLGTKKLQGARSGKWGMGHNHHFVLSRNGGILLTLQRFNENRWRPL